VLERKVLGIPHRNTVKTRETDIVLSRAAPLWSACGKMGITSLPYIAAHDSERVARFRKTLNKGTFYTEAKRFKTQRKNRRCEERRGPVT
jgi:hypothetical protein